MKSKLHIAGCSHQDAAYACKHWHYAGVIPAFKIVKLGVWEDDSFIGCVIFGLGPNAVMGRPYGLQSHELSELQRVALREHKAPVSRIVSIAVRIFRTHCPGTRLLVSYADQNQDHHGGIYQALNWIYVGEAAHGQETYFAGKKVHRRTINQRFGSSAGVTYVPCLPKHKYLFPLDDAMRERILPLSKPYPKRAGSAGSGTSGSQPERDGAIPISALQTLP